MAAGPCLNPNCKSNGAPHPNCRCYGPGMAEGGEIKDFCDTNGTHDANCEYYAEGGEIIPDSETQQPQIVPDSETQASAITPDSENPEYKKEKYGSLGQQALTGIEGLAHGIAGPLATGAELGLSKLGVPGISAEDIAGRKEENPWTHVVAETAGLLSPIGEGAAVAKIAEHLVPAAASISGKIGAAALKNMIGAGLFQTGDEVSNAMLGQGDPETPVASALFHVGAAGLFGLGMGALFGASSQGLQKLADEKVGAKASEFIKDFGDRWNQRTGEGPLFERKNNLLMASKNKEAITAGHRFADTVFDKAPEKIGSTLARGIATGIGEKIGGHAGGLGSYYIADQLTPKFEKIIGKPITKVAIPAIIKALSSEKAEHVLKAVDYANQVNKGFQKFNSGVKNVLTSTGQQAVDAYATDRDREKLKEYIEKGGVNQDIQAMQHDEPQAYAEGGAIQSKESGLAQIYPEHNMLINAAKGRVSQYLTSKRPVPGQKLPFDKEMKDHQKERSYNRAIDIALKPLSVLNHIKNGTLTPDHVQHITSMYPELKSQIDKKLTQELSQKQYKEEKPKYHTRLSMSLFMGSPMDSTMTPALIQAAQPIPAQQPQQGNRPKPAKLKTKDTNVYKTPEQAAESDRSSRD